MTNESMAVGAYDIFTEGLLRIMETQGLSLEEARDWAISAIIPDPEEDRKPLIEAAYQRILNQQKIE